MLYTPHFLTGAAILTLVPDPIIGLPLAFVSHILLDLTPHNDFGLRPGITLKDIFNKDKKMKRIILGVVGVDILLMIILAFLLFYSTKNYLLLFGGLVGILPDLFDQTLMVLGIPLPAWQDKLQWRVSAKYGFISYPIVSLAALYIIMNSIW